MRLPPQAWLLEPENPSAQYFTLTQLLGFAPDHPQVSEAQQAIMASTPVQAILDAQFPAGYWIKPDLGISPRYRATVWQVLFLAGLGAMPTEPVALACEYVFNQVQQSDGRFVAHQGRSGATLCLNGSLLRALLALGYQDDPRLARATDGLTAHIEHAGWSCPRNADQPCASGAIKVLGALLQHPDGLKDASQVAAVAHGLALLSRQPLLEMQDPLCYDGPQPRWLRLGAFLGDASDVLEGLNVLRLAGHGDDPQFAPAFDWLRARADPLGRWHLEISPGKLWFDPGPVDQPSKWVTLRALRALPRPAGQHTPQH
jgi:hypothetical protein